MSKKLRIGFIGAGGMARAHTDGLKKMDDVEIAAFTDARPDAAQKMAAEFGAKSFDTPAQLCKDGGVDCVYILLPPFAHGDAERAAIDSKIPFFIEKPVGLDLRKTRELASETERVGLITCAGYMNRYRKGVNVARDAFLKDPPVIIHGGWIGGTPKPPAPPNYNIVSWWIQKDKSGGQFLEQVTHTVDLLRYLAGDATEVFAFAANGFNKGIPNYTMDDAAVVNIRLKSGGVANLMACSASNSDGGVWLNVYATKNSAKFTDWEHHTVLKSTDDPLKEVRIKGEPDIFAVEDRAFLDAVRAKNAAGIRSSFADAVKTLEISVAANQSIATGRSVAIKG